MNAPHSMLDHADQLQALTREYARFSHSAGGLAAVAGGVLCLASWLAGGLLPVTPVLQATLIATPLVWLILKQWMASRYYQRFGQAEERVPLSERRMRVVFAGFTALVSIAVVAGRWTDAAAPSGMTSVAYMLTVLAMPVVVWRWLRNPLEFAIGVFLMCQAALAFIGQSYPLWSGAAVFPVVALIMIGAGISDHRKFRGIEARIRELLSSPRVEA